MSIQKWEYLALNFEVLFIAADEPNTEYAGMKVSEALAKAGALGWELTSVTGPQVVEGNKLLCGAMFFKRRA